MRAYARVYNVYTIHTKRFLLVEHISHSDKLIMFWTLLICVLLFSSVVTRTIIPIHRFSVSIILLIHVMCVNMRIQIYGAVTTEYTVNVLHTPRITGSFVTVLGYMCIYVKGVTMLIQKTERRRTRSNQKAHIVLGVRPRTDQPIRDFDDDGLRTYIYIYALSASCSGPTSAVYYMHKRPPLYCERRVFI